jgi:hypothetical protein
MHQPKDERSLGDLFSDLTRELSTLIRQETTLAKTELSEKVSSVGKDAGTIAVGGAIAYAGFLAIVAAVILVLGFVLPLWLSALIVGAVVTGIGGLLVQKGRSGLKHADLTPHQTIETLKEDRQWMKDRA